jgi:hypothetical protein
MENYTQMIEELNVPEEVRDYLKRVEAVASSENPKVKCTVQDIYIQSPSTRELSRMAKVYESIITGCGVYPFRGVGTYVELAFPYRGSELDYKDFFASPRRVASTQNFFSGVFLCSFEQWQNAEELVRDPAFETLLAYIDSYKDRISFVFHVTPDMREAQVLFRELGSHVNLVRLGLSYPGMEEARAYLRERMTDAGFELSEEAGYEMDRLMEEKIDFESSAYLGYRTLESFSQRILFELCSEKKTEVSGEEIARLADVIDTRTDAGYRPRMIGFI